MGVGETGQIIGETGVGEVGVIHHEANAGLKFHWKQSPFLFFFTQLLMFFVSVFNKYRRISS